jgi:CRP/FNR family transcriptional regulator, cyclic AMP receptor protein
MGIPLQQDPEIAELAASTLEPGRVGSPQRVHVHAAGQRRQELDLARADLVHERGHLVAPANLKVAPQLSVRRVLDDDVGHGDAGIHEGGQLGLDLISAVAHGDDLAESGGRRFLKHISARRRHYLVPLCPQHRHVLADRGARDLELRAEIVSRHGAMGPPKQVEDSLASIIWTHVRHLSQAYHAAAGTVPAESGRYHLVRLFSGGAAMTGPTVDSEGGFLAAMRPEEITEFQSRGTRRRYRRGAMLFTEGEISDKVVLVVEGRVKISHYTDDGREVLLAVRGPGEVLGELSAIDGEPRSAAASALDPVEALVVPAEDFRHFLEAQPRIASVLLRTVTRRLRDADRKRIEFAAQDTVGRVAGRLVELAERFGEPEGEGVRITLPLTQQELAGWTGASREAVSKALQILRQRGWVSTHRRGVTVMDMPALRRRAT